MNCTSCQDLFSAYLDKDLNPHQSATVDRHLADCRICAREWNYFRKTVGMLNALYQVSAPATLHAEIQQRLVRLEHQSIFTRLVSWFRDADFSLSAPAAAATVAAAVAVMATIKYFPGTIERLSPYPTGFHQANGKKQDPAESGNQKTRRPQEVTPGASDAFALKSASPHWPIPEGILVTDVMQMIGGGPRYPEQIQFTHQFNVPSNQEVQPYFHNLFSMTEQYGYGIERPDVTIVVKKMAGSDHGDLLHKLVNADKWRANILDATHLRLIVDLDDLPLLQEMLSNHLTDYSPPSAKHTTAGYPKKELTINIILR